MADESAEFEHLRQEMLAGRATPEQLDRLCDLITARDRRLQSLLAFIRGPERRPKE